MFGFGFPSGGGGGGQQHRTFRPGWLTNNQLTTEGVAVDAMASMPSDCALPDNIGGGSAGGGGGGGGASAFASYQGALLFMQSAVAKVLATGDPHTAAQETAQAAAQLYAQFYSSGVVDQAGAFWAMLGQAVQADAGRACGSPVAASRLAQAVANAPTVMASAGKKLGGVMPQGMLLQMLGPIGLFQAVRVASQALLPSMTEGFQTLISQRSTAPSPAMATGPIAGPQTGGWPYAPPPAANPYGQPAAGGPQLPAYPQPPAGPAGYASARGRQAAAPSYPAPYLPSASAYPPPAGWAMGGLPATAPPAASPLQAGLSIGRDCSAATQEAPSAPPLPGKEGTSSASKFPEII